MNLENKNRLTKDIVLYKNFIDAGYMYKKDWQKMKTGKKV